VKPSHLMTTADVSVIESLADWDTPALSNALDALRLQPRNTGALMPFQLAPAAQKRPPRWRLSYPAPPPTARSRPRRAH
jgi:hypothetical protein